MADFTIPDTRCVCRECGHEIDVSFILCTFGKGPYRGWPRHCGRQMRMVSTSCDIDKGMEQALRPVKAQVEEVIARFAAEPQP